MVKKRYKRYKLKLDPHIVARRFAQVQEVSTVSWGSIVPNMVRVEIRVLPILEEAGVPGEDIPNYLGAAKSAAAEALQFGSKTLVEDLGVENQVYEDRLLDPEILALIIPQNTQVVADLGGISRAEYEVAVKDKVETTEPFSMFTDACLASEAYVSILPEETVPWIPEVEGVADETYVEYCYVT
jgi:hypothetical protein